MLRPRPAPGRPRRIAVAAVWGWSIVAGGVFLWLASARGIPAGPEGEVFSPALSRTLHLVVLALAAAGLVIALRRPAVGGWCLAVAAIALGTLASVEYTPTAAFAATAVFLLPAFALLAADQPDRGEAATWAVVAACLVLLGGGWIAADGVHRRVFGPFHPTSTTPALTTVSVRWMWSGGVTNSGFRVVARLRRAGATARLVVGRRPDLADAAPGAAVRADGDGIVRLTAAGLDADTRYHYAVEVDGRRDDPRRGTVRTFPEGPASFTVAVASCATTGSNGRVFDAIREARPLLYVQTGDLFYANVGANQERRFLSAYDATLTAPAQAALYRAVPVAYVWDDHDYGTNNSGRNARSRPAAMATYRRLVPHAPLAIPGDEAPIAQALTIGRIRLILTDTRSVRDPSSVPDGPAKSMLGAAQRRWLLEEAARATSNGLLPVWVNPDPWIGPARAGDDSWAGYADERRRIADGLAARGVTSLVMLSGDAHMVAADDGTNSGYRTGGGGGFPVLQAAALDELGTIRGGPYSAGARAGAGQWGLMRITDDGGDTIRVRLEGLDWNGRRILGVDVTLPVRAPAT